MKRSIGLLAALFCTAGMMCQVQAQGQNGLKVCPDPVKPWHTSYKTFAPYELSFQLPAKIKPNVDYKSAPFYAVLCKTFPPTNEDDCTEGEYSAKVEAERRRAQALVPNRKAFAENQCPDMAAVGYDINGKTFTGQFVAVYGGTTRAEAEQVRTRLKSRYPNATIAPMRAVFQYIVQ